MLRKKQVKSFENPLLDEVTFNKLIYTSMQIANNITELRSFNKEDFKVELELMNSFIKQCENATSNINKLSDNEIKQVQQIKNAETKVRNIVNALHDINDKNTIDAAQKILENTETLESGFKYPHLSIFKLFI